MDVLQSERVEFFMRRNEKMDPYFCFEIDPLGRVLDYSARNYRMFDYHWQWPEQLNIRAKIYDDKYTVEGRFSLAMLKKMGLLHEHKIQAGLFRGHCKNLQGNTAAMQWISWVDPNIQPANFHIHSAFGCLTLETF